MKKEVQFKIIHYFFKDKLLDKVIESKIVRETKSQFTLENGLRFSKKNNTSLNTQKNNEIIKDIFYKNTLNKDFDSFFCAKIIPTQTL
jgi:hypothetical protein